jgi:hypothetical protein
MDRLERAFVGRAVFEAAEAFVEQFTRSARSWAEGTPVDHQLSAVICRSGGRETINARML